MMWTHNTFIGEDNVHKLYYNAAFMADSFSRSVCHLHHGLESTNLQRNLVSTKKIQNIFIWSPIIKRLINFYKWYLLHSYSISLKLIRFSNEKQKLIAWNAQRELHLCWNQEFDRAHPLNRILEKTKIICMKIETFEWTLINIPVCVSS